MTRDGALRLPGGRSLCFERVGAADGFPVMYCHGFPSSRLEARLFREAAQAGGVTLIAADRPGFGGSGFQPARRIADWGEDVRALADHLSLHRFSVMGVSGGAPYAIACALAMPERVGRLGIVCGLGAMSIPEDTREMAFAARAFIALSRKWPRVAEICHRSLFGPIMFRFPATVVAILNAAAPPPDRRVMADPALRGLYAAAFREAFRGGGRGPARDLYLYTHAWGIDAAALQMPVFLWHGEADRTVPVAMGYRYAERIRGCHARFYREHGHFSLPVACMNEILKTMIPD